MTTIAELEQQQAEIAKRLAEMRASARQEVLAQIRALMSEHGLSAADLNSASPRKTSSALSGTKVQPKYRNPATGATWTGRGLKPKWLKESLEAGKSLDEFRIGH